jgi:formylglycine-generating enzyme required for sulfatase activity
VESAEARQELPKLLRDPRWRDTVRYALSAAARQRKGDVLQELVEILIRAGRVFWVWEALLEDRLSAQSTDAWPSGGTSRTAPVVIDRAWDTLCRWLVHRDQDGYGAWKADCPLSAVESTVEVWSSLFDRGVREGRALSAAWELVKRGQDSTDPQVRDESVKLYNQFLGEWPELVAGRDPLSQRSLDQQTVRLVLDLAWNRERDLAEVKADQEITQVRYCRVPPQGDTHSYQMGSPKDEPDRFDDEEQQSVTVRAFWLRNFPVTNGEYELFDPGHRERRTEQITATDQPVVNVSWWECQLLCEWLGGAYRLPTEEEWEGACRAGTPMAYWYGRDPDELAQHAWFAHNSTWRTHTLGESSKKGKVPAEGHVNPWGLVDMHGNVWEWCALPGDAPLGQPCPIRGGSWFGSARGCRSAIRSADAPEFRGDSLGLRLVPSPSQPDTSAQPDAQVRCVRHG